MEQVDYDSTSMVRITDHNKEQLRAMKERGESFNSVITKLIATAKEAKLRIKEE